MPNDFIFSGIFITVTEEQSSKELFPISVTVSGMVIEVKVEHPLNKSFGIASRSFRNLIEVHPSKTFLPIDMIVDGILIFVSDGHPLKAKQPIDSIEAGNTI